MKTNEFKKIITKAPVPVFRVKSIPAAIRTSKYLSSFIRKGMYVYWDVSNDSFRTTPSQRFGNGTLVKLGASNVEFVCYRIV